MSTNGAGREFGSTPPTESDCKLHSLAEALKEGKRPPADRLGTVACMQCLGVFVVDAEPDAKKLIDNPGHVSCLLGYANNPEAHLED